MKTARRQVWLTIPVYNFLNEQRHPGQSISGVLEELLVGKALSDVPPLANKPNVGDKLVVPKGILTNSALDTDNQEPPTTQALQVVKND